MTTDFAGMFFRACSHLVVLTALAACIVPQDLGECGYLSLQKRPCFEFTDVGDGSQRIGAFMKPVMFLKVVQIGNPERLYHRIVCVKISFALHRHEHSDAEILRRSYTSFNGFATYTYTQRICTNVRCVDVCASRDGGSLSVRVCVNL